MIEEVKDFIEDVKDRLGDKGFTVLVACLCGVAVYLVYRSSKSGGTEYYAPTGVTGYPDIGENADVVMDSVNKTIEGSINDFSGMMDSRLEYIEGVLENIEEEAVKNTEEIIQNTNQNTNTIIQNSNQNTNSIIQNSNQNTQEIKQEVNNAKQEEEEYIRQTIEFVNALRAEVESVENATQTYTPPKTTVAKPATTQTPKPETYTYTQKAGLNTNTSIVDALKASGADSSFQARAEIYYANGGKGTYTGSYSQNVDMLNKMKSGNLKKA